MSNVKYSFDKEVNIPRLTKEIQESSITVALDHIKLLGSSLEIWMKETLSGSEVIALGIIVGNHVNIPLPDDSPMDLDDKSVIHETSKPLGFYTCFTSQGDDLSNPTNVGDGTKLAIVHEVGQPIKQSVYMDLNIKENVTLIHEGYIQWKGAEFDLLDLEIVPMVTPYTSGTGTFFNVYGPLIVPAAGDGTAVVDVADIKLVEMTVLEGTRKRSPGYWNAIYDPITHTFSNLTPAPNGDGIYNIFALEQVFCRFVNKAMFLENGFMMLQTADAAELGHGTRIKLTVFTEGVDHAWKAACIIVLHRNHLY